MPDVGDLWPVLGFLPMDVTFPLCTPLESALVLSLFPIPADHRVGDKHMFARSDGDSADRRRDVSALSPSHRVAPGIHQSTVRLSYHLAMAPQAKMTEQAVNVRLPRDLHEAVIGRAAAEDRTMAQTIRVALRYYLQETKPITSATS
jgi:hypothetical protein